jgi:hypothetical protein
LFSSLHSQAVGFLFFFACVRSLQVCWPDFQDRVPANVLVTEL